VPEEKETSSKGRRMQSSSYYAVLGVRPGASAAEIRAAYHRLAMVSTTSLPIIRSVDRSSTFRIALVCPGPESKHGTEH
jgi:hypothetical protein